MGQNGSLPNNPMLSDWKQNIHEPNIYTNIKTKDQVQKFSISPNSFDQSLYKKRMQQQHLFIAKVHYYQVGLNKSSNKQLQTCSVYTDRIMPIKKNKWQQVFSSLNLLKGFRRLSTSFGLMRVNQSMVGMNEKDQIKVWINKNPAINQITQKANNEEQMLTDIAKIIIKYDTQTGGLLIGCFTLNEAINNILVNMTESKTQTNLSSRTLRPQQKSKKVLNKGQFSNKNNNLFRSTKQTEDDFPKPLYSSEKRDEKLIQNKSLTSKYLVNVHMPGSPKYVQLGSQTEKKGLVGYKNNISQMIQRNHIVNFSQKISPKQSNSIQFNSFNQDKRENQQNAKKVYRQVQHKFPSNYQFGGSSIYGYNTGSPKHQINLKNTSPEYGAQNSLKKTSDIHYYQRKSDLNRDILVGRVEQARASDFPGSQASKIKIGYSQKFKQQKNNSQKDIPFYNPKQEGVKGFGNRKTSQNFRFDSQNRTKTQQFSSVHLADENSWNSYGSQPQHKRKLVLKSEIQNEQVNKNYESNFNKRKVGTRQDNFLSKNSEINKIDLVNSTKIQIVEDQKSPVPHSSKDNQSYKLQKIKSFPNVSSSSKNQQASEEKDSSKNYYEERKVKKQQMSKKIRQEFSSILSPSRGESDGQVKLNKQKSSKDILIREKIEKKKAIFAGLKTQAMKVLMGD